MTNAARHIAAIGRLLESGHEGQGVDVSGRRARVLLVDDHPQICQLVDAVLRQAGFDVVATTKPAAALAAAGASDFDVVVSDVHMPSLSGPKLYAALHALQPPLPVVFISAAASAADLPAGAPLIRKPFNFSELVSAVNRVLLGETATAVR